MKADNHPVIVCMSDIQELNKKETIITKQLLPNQESRN